MVDLADGRTIGARIFLLDAIIGEVFSRTHQRVLSRRNAVVHDVGFVMFIIQPQLLNDSFYDAFCIIRVVNREAGGETNFGGFAA